MGRLSYPCINTAGKNLGDVQTVLGALGCLPSSGTQLPAGPSGLPGRMEVITLEMPGWYRACDGKDPDPVFGRGHWKND